MTRLFLLATCAATLTFTHPAIAQQSDEDAYDGVSYMIGKNTGDSMMKEGFPLNAEAFMEGLTDGLEGRESRISQAEAQAFFQRVSEIRAAELAASGTAYLKENATKEGVVTTDSGLQYRVLSQTEGGDTPTETDRVTVHYTGKLIDGTVFDSSVARGAPATFGLNQVIPGWTIGLQLMTVGDRFEFTIPHTLAYGSAGSGDAVPPFATLIFEVELIAIE